MRITIITGAVLLVPLVAMQFSEEVDWSLSDFMIMGGLIFITGMALELIAKRVGDSRRRLAAMSAVALAFLLIWAELAVGVFGSPFAGS